MIIYPVGLILQLHVTENRLEGEIFVFPQHHFAMCVVMYIVMREKNCKLFGKKGTFAALILWSQTIYVYSLLEGFTPAIL